MDLERRLADARARLEAAVKALAPKHKGGEEEELRAAHTALLVAERDLAESKGEEHAVPLEFPVQWDVGAPLPHLLVNDSRALLLFLVRETDPKWDGTHVTVKDPASMQGEPLAVVEFKRCVSAKLGSPNDGIAEGFAVEVRDSSMPELLAEACRRLVGYHPSP